MRKVVFILSFLLALPAGIAVSETTHELEKIVVTPSRITNSQASSGRSVKILDETTFANSVYNSIPDLIGNEGGIDMRRRGPEGVQADISIRGTSFEQNSVMIDAVKMDDPQTGHHTMDLPVTMADIDRIEILKGPASSLYGPNSFGGVINIITKRPDERKVVAWAEGGTFDYFSGGASVSVPMGNVSNRFSFEEKRSTGYMPETEFNILSLSNTASITTDYGSHDFMFGYLKKDFGADSFYSNLFSNEEEHTDTRFFKLGTDIKHKDLSVDLKLFLKRHWDKFALDRNRPGWQTNYHTTYNYGGEIDFVLENPFLDISYGFELSRDTIDSTNIQRHQRTKSGIFIEAAPRLGDRLSLTVGMREDRFSDFGWEYSPSISGKYKLLDGLSIRSAIGRSYRVPTFTDLYYKDSANIGNPDLRPESCWSYEVGLDGVVNQVSYSMAVFRRDSRDTIDWTRTAANLPWQVSNIGTVATNGLEISLSLEPKELDESFPVDRIFLDYTALDSYRKHDYLSKYALDYLKDHISAGLIWSVFSFKNSWALNYKRRIGDSGYMTVDTRISKDIFKLKGVKCQLFFEVSNLFDADYSEQSGIPMPGRWIKSGGRVEF